MNNYRLQIVTDADAKTVLQHLYETSAFTFEGMDTAEQNLQAIADFFISKGAIAPINITVITGKQMNDICKLTGSNAYNKKLSIMSISPYGKLLAKQIGARWMDDIINNNAKLEGFHPFLDTAKTEDSAGGIVKIKELNLADDKLKDSKISIIELLQRADKTDTKLKDDGNQIWLAKQLGKK